MQLIVVPRDERRNELVRLRIQRLFFARNASLERRVDAAFGGDQDLGVQLVLAGFVNETRKHDQLQQNCQSMRRPAAHP
ncbi:hypothetical protein [Burkholderia sp. F1]|uniref:hypothetical protein n=1 Tax=Burkholderia sp. F1 TaxID=3366817 RepID=UPI003D73B30B